jgi:starch phosphorylase
MPVRSRVHLGHLSPQDLLVELYVGRVDMNGELVNGEAVAMEQRGQRNDGIYNYMVTTSIARSGLHGFTVRVRPYHPEMSVKFVPGLICWARQSDVAATMAM